MLGITTADSIAFGSLVLALLAAWRGATIGEARKKEEPVQPPAAQFQLGMATFADSRMMERLVETLDRIAESIDNASAASDKRHEGRMAHAIEELSKRFPKGR